MRFRIIPFLVFCALGTAILCHSMALPAQAQGFILNGTGGLESDKLFSNRSYRYFFTPTAGTTNPAAFGTKWGTVLTDSPGDLIVPPNPDRNLTATIQTVGGAFSPGPLFTYNFANLPTSVNELPLNTLDVRGQAQQLNQGNFSYITRTSVVTRGFITEPPAAAGVTMSGIVDTPTYLNAGGGGGAGVPNSFASFTNFRWSLENPVGNAPITSASLTASYIGVNTSTPFTINQPNPLAGLAGGLAGGKRTGGPLPGTARNPDTNELGRLADYSLSGAGSPLSTMTLAFLGTYNGSPSEIDLLYGALLFAGLDQEFLVPMFDDADGVDPMYASVDLSQWLSAPDELLPNSGDLFSIVNGVSSLLPGFLFSNSPIIDTGSGFSTTDPFTGQVEVRAFVDGGAATTPEPGTLALMGLGALGVVLLRRRADKGQA